jgi:hypothetical protein
MPTAVFPTAVGPATTQIRGGSAGCGTGSGAPESPVEVI